MTRNQFVEAHGEAVQTFLNSQAGLAFRILLSEARPLFESQREPHLFAENTGVVKGYELCLRNIVSLSALPKVAEEIEADYGVPNISQQSE